MITYSVTMGITLLTYLFMTHSTQDTKRISRITITVFFVMYLFLLCFRDSTVGVDTGFYVNILFKQIQFLSWPELVNIKNMELGFTYLTKLISYFGSMQIFIGSIAILSVVPVMYLYRNESEDAILCCSFFLISLLFEIYFSGMRQGVALGLSVPAYYFARKSKLIPFLLMVLIAVSFHTSALIIALIFPVYHAKITKKWLWFVIPLMVLFYSFKSSLFDYLLKNIQNDYTVKYEYLTTNFSGQIGLMTLFVLISLYSFFMLDETIANEDDIGLRNLLLLCTAIQFFTPLHPVVSRLNYYFILFIPVTLSRVNLKCQTRYRPISMMASFEMSIFFIFYFFFLKDDTLQISSYRFFF